MVRRRGHLSVAPSGVSGASRGWNTDGANGHAGWLRGTKGDLPWGIVHPAESDPPTAHKLEVTMKMVKSLLLGTAAGLVAVAGSQAADLPAKAKPVEYVKICTAYEEWFFYIPGTDTCIKIGGFVRQNFNFGQASGSFSARASGAGGRDNPIDQNSWVMQSTFVTSFDVRTQTEYGTLRAFTRAGFRVE